MNKSAIFVDAGYLLARGGLVVCGTQRRAEFNCAYESLIQALTGLSTDRDLVREADEHLALAPDFLKKFFSSLGGATRDQEITSADVAAAGKALGRQWAERATRSETQAILDQKSISREIDAQLLRDSGRDLGVSRIPDELVGDLRAAFRESLEEALAEPSTGEASLA